MCTHLNNDNVAAAAVAVPMVDDDNEPAPENHPVANKTVLGLMTSSVVGHIMASVSTDQQSVKILNQS